MLLDAESGRGRGREKKMVVAVVLLMMGQTVVMRSLTQDGDGRRRLGGAQGRGERRALWRLQDVETIAIGVILVVGQVGESAGGGVRAELIELVEEVGRRVVRVVVDVEETRLILRASSAVVGEGALHGGKVHRVVLEYRPPVDTGK